MKPRAHDFMVDVLALVRNSNLAEATARLRNVLPGPGAGAPGSKPDDPTLLSRRASASPRPRPLGDVLQALRAGRALWPKTPQAPNEKSEYPLDDKFTLRLYHGAAGSLSYRLYVPDLAGRDPALVLMLHGCTQNPEDFALGTQMNKLADDFGLVVAYPHQPRAANSSGCWNWFDQRHQRRGSGEPAKLAGLAQSVAREFGVANGRIFAAGLSAGGAMAEILASTYPDVFDAVAIHSGLPYGAAHDLPSAFAAMKGSLVAKPELRAVTDHVCRRIVFHGGADATVHPVNATRIFDQIRRGPESLKEVGTEWEIEGGHVSRTILQDAGGRAVHEHWFVEGGRHAWFGGDARGSYTQGNGVDASREVVRFFLRQ